VPDAEVERVENRKLAAYSSARNSWREKSGYTARGNFGRRKGRSEAHGPRQTM